LRRSAVIPKRKFQWWHRNGSGWASGKPENAGVLLYRLDEIVKCNVAIIVEGEKDADRLVAIDWSHLAPGLVVGCTTAPDGANTWQVEEYGPYFTGKRTYVIPDSDPPGVKYEKDVTRSVLKYAAELHVVRLPPDSKDVSEFLDHHTVDELVKLIETAPLIEIEPESRAVVDGYTLVHIGELLDRPDTPMDYIWEGRAVAGTLSLCVAKPKVGKGTIARNLALSVSRGDSLFGWATKKGLVIYLALEE
jgi:AAA domain